MTPGRPSRTAEAAAAFRAAHQWLDQPLVLADPLAAPLLGIDLGASSPGSVFLQWLLERRLRRRLPPWLSRRPALGIRRTRAQIVVRGRYAEDTLEAAVRTGLRQYVLLAAGLDSFALRRPDLLEQLTVFEVDHPSTQAFKRQRLGALHLIVPPSLVYVPIDFERQTLAQALSGSSYDAERPAFFSWLGVTYYLTNEAIRETFEFVARQASGSRLVFDYWRALGLRSPADQALLAMIRVSVASQGEAMRSFFDPDQMARLVENSGLSLIESLSPEAAGERYLASRSDGLVLPEFAYLAHVGVG